MRYPRNMLGYGKSPPDPRWPGGAYVAVQIVLNYEEGGENNVLHGDAASEAFLSDVIGAAPWPGQRHANVESMYEYGARAGFWRLWRYFTGNAIPVTVYGVATALMRAPQQVLAMQEAGWEIASHGLKWVQHKDMPEAEERAAIAEAIRLHTIATGERPYGWYTGRSSLQTVDLTSEEGGFDYISDTYDDDLPYWRPHKGRAQLVIWYTLAANDMRFVTAPGFDTGEEYFQFLKDSFDVLYEEGRLGSPKMMSLGLHCRLVGMPGRFAGLKRFLDYVRTKDKVWLARRIDIARHWAQHHPYKAPDLVPSQMDRTEFVGHFGSIFEHSPWIAERAFDGELGPANDTASGLHFALRSVFRAASEHERMGVLKAHPDLAGKLAQAQRLTDASTSEQASAGLDALTDHERAEFEELNAAYMAKFGFPFIIAVRDNTKPMILSAMHTRLGNDKHSEFRAACGQVERIALLRLRAVLPELKMYVLHITNKNYTSWSLRPWVLLRTLGIPFEERLHVLPADGPSYPEFSKFSPTGFVPVLDDGDIKVWDSLAIVLHVAERHPNVWPEAAAARSWARSAAAEMHSGFSALRNTCGVNLGIRARLASISPALQRDLDRLDELWNEGLDRFGGPFLAGAAFSAVDAFFCPVAFRAQSYGLRLGGNAMDYVARLLALPAMMEWYAAGIAETSREPNHEAETTLAHILIEDLRARA